MNGFDPIYIVLAVNISLLIINLVILKLVVDTYVYLRKVDTNLTRMMEGLTFFINAASKLIDTLTTRPQPRYTTDDGKFTADSMEELLQKMHRNDRDEDGLTPEEIDRIKKLLEEEDEED